jgi:hypothetical protein
MEPAKRQSQVATLIENIITGIEHTPAEIKRKHQLSVGGRDPEMRRIYVGDPAKYFRDILGWNLTPQQEEALQLIEQFDRVLIPSGNNLGKTFLLSGYAVYRFDAVASLPDEDRGLEEQGAQILLPGPDHATVYQTVYNSILEHAQRAEHRGFLMPQGRSERSVLWRVRARWHMEPFAPSKRVDQAVRHSASGRHHINQVALIEEGQGVDEALWKAVEGMCSSSGNKIISAFNPTEPSGPTYQRALQGGWHVLHINAFEHPNVRGRTVVVPDAISFKVVDNRVRDECRDRGPYPATTPEEDRGDFVYALPPSLTSEEYGPRPDQHLGHPEGKLHVYRPSPSFEAQVLGQWPRSISTGLFDPGSWDAAARLWDLELQPDRAPDRVGVDVAREGADETCLCPVWGGVASDLIRDYHAALTEHDEEEMDKILRTRKVFVGEILSAPAGDGPTTARWIANRFPYSPLNIDESGVGASVLDHLKEVMDRDATGISFARTPGETLPGEVICLNMRAAMYVRAARLVNTGLVEVPPDELLREEVMAHELVHTEKVVKITGSKKRERKPAVRILDKDAIRKKIGRSPDRADAFVLALTSGGKLNTWNIW